MTDKPTPKSGFTNTRNLPEDLKRQGLFCLWKYEQNNGRWTKVPHQPERPEYGAASTNPQHFTDLQTAVRAGAGFDGLGLGIFGDIAAVDIDHCIDQAGNLSQLARNVIDTLDSYTERSPSGNGIRIVFRAPGIKYDTEQYLIKNSKASEPGENWPDQQGLEIYIAGMTNRYVTITGDTIRAAGINDRGREILEVVSRYMRKAPKQSAPSPAPLPPSPVEVSDEDILAAAYRARNGAQFQALFDGDISGYPSHSEADQALFNALAFYTGKDQQRMIELFRRSGLYRPGEKPKYESYLARTADKAIRDCTKTYTPPRQRTSPPPVVIDTPAAEDTPPEIRQPADSVSALDSFLEKAQTRAYEPIPTGISDIDRAINGGFIRQTLVTLGAAPAAGKTILAQQIFEKIATAGTADVLFFNLEMSTEQLIARSLSRATGISQLDILQGYKWEKKWARTITAAAMDYRQRTAPHIAYNPPDRDGHSGSAYYEDIVQTMEDEAAARPDRPLAVVVDYLQLLRSKTTSDDVETIKAALKCFKDFAIKYNAVVFLIMAHSRATNESGKAVQGAGRDTSAIEYSGDLQLSLNYLDIVNGTYRNMDKLKEAAEHDPKIYDRRALVVTKNRFGKGNTRCDLTFIGEQSKFDLTDHRHNPPQRIQRI